MASLYLKILSIVFVFFMMVVGLFNFIVDPFDLFPSPKIDNFNAEKTELHKHQSLSKPHAIRFYKPRGIILGTSRAEYGLDPKHPGWSPSAQPVYNLGVSNGRIEETLQLLKHAYAHGKLKQVVLGADFFMFGNQFKINAAFDPTRLSNKDKKDTDFGWYKDIMNSLFTLDALFSSIATINNQKKGDSILYFPNGMRSSKSTWKQILKKGGHHSAFISNIKQSLRDKAGLATFTLGENKNKASPTLDAFSSLVRFCLERDIELKIIISPIHAYKLETLYHLGLWELYEYWKTRISIIVETENKRIPNSIAAELWDFSGYNTITMERVPGKNEPKKRMNWYWEGSHYRHAVGNKILDCIFEKNPSNKCSFGQKVDSTNISQHLLETRIKGIHYRLTHKDDIMLIKSLIKETEKERNKLRSQMGWTEPRF